jgi:hypothetical protein
MKRNLEPTDKLFLAATGFVALLAGLCCGLMQMMHL